MTSPSSNSNQRFEQITIDGPAASGKSTVARRVAVELGGIYVNTGEIYRAFTWFVLDHDIDPVTDRTGVVDLLSQCDLALKSEPGNETDVHLYLNNRVVDRTSVRHPHVTQNVSYVARIPEVRRWLVDHQRSARTFGLIVVEGRDIGTVVFPEARHKFFLTVTAQERAKRRLAQSGEIDNGSTVESVAAEIAHRDHLDSTRSVAPLKAATDATILDTTNLSIDQVAAQIVEIVHSRWL